MTETDESFILVPRQSCVLAKAWKDKATCPEGYGQWLQSMLTFRIAQSLRALPAVEYGELAGSGWRRVRKQNSWKRRWKRMGSIHRSFVIGDSAPVREYLSVTTIPLAGIVDMDTAPMTPAEIVALTAFRTPPTEIVARLRGGVEGGAVGNDRFTGGQVQEYIPSVFLSAKRTHRRSQSPLYQNRPPHYRLHPPHYRWLAQIVINPPPYRDERGRDDEESYGSFMRRYDYRASISSPYLPAPFPVQSAHTHDTQRECSHRLVFYDYHCPDDDTQWFSETLFAEYRIGKPRDEVMKALEEMTQGHAVWATRLYYVNVEVHIEEERFHVRSIALPLKVSILSGTLKDGALSSIIPLGLSVWGEAESKIVFVRHAETFRRWNAPKRRKFFLVPRLMSKKRRASRPAPDRSTSGQHDTTTVHAGSARVFYDLLATRMQAAGVLPAEGIPTKRLPTVLEKTERGDEAFAVPASIHLAPSLHLRPSLRILLIGGSENDPAPTLSYTLTKLALERAVADLSASLPAASTLWVYDRRARWAFACPPRAERKHLTDVEHEVMRWAGEHLNQRKRGQGRVYTVQYLYRGEEMRRCIQAQAPSPTVSPAQKRTSPHLDQVLFRRPDLIVYLPDLTRHREAEEAELARITEYASRYLVPLLAMTPAYENASGNLFDNLSGDLSSNSNYPQPQARPRPQYHLQPLPLSIAALLGRLTLGMGEGNEDEDKTKTNNKAKTHNEVSSGGEFPELQGYGVFFIPGFTACPLHLLELVSGRDGGEDERADERLDEEAPAAPISLHTFSDATRLVVLSYVQALALITEDSTTMKYHPKKTYSSDLFLACTRDNAPVDVAADGIADTKTKGSTASGSLEGMEAAPYPNYVQKAIARLIYDAFPGIVVQAADPLCTYCGTYRSLGKTTTREQQWHLPQEQRTMQVELVLPRRRELDLE